MILDLNTYFRVKLKLLEKKGTLLLEYRPLEKVQMLLRDLRVPKKKI